MFDLTDLKSDLHEFNDFYNNLQGGQLGTIERPQNPFHKNFQSYQDKPQRNSFSAHDSEFLQQPLKKQSSHDHLSDLQGCK
jgi:hypothetical protein